MADEIARPPCQLLCGPVQTDECLADYYAHRAPEMEEAFAVPERHADLVRLRELLRRLVSGQDVLEIACGTGYWTQVMAGTARSITASDISEEMLALAQAKSYAGKLVTFVRDNAWSLHAVRGRFTAGAALFWWSHMPKSKVRCFVTQWHRVLEPAAQVVVVDNLRGDCRWAPPVRTDSEGNTYQRRMLHSGECFDIIKNYPAEEEVLNSIAGLADDVSYLALRCVWVLTYRARR